MFHCFMPSETIKSKSFTNRVAKGKSENVQQDRLLSPPKTQHTPAVKVAAAFQATATTMSLNSQQQQHSPPLPPPPRPLFVYGTLRAMPLLAWALTGDASNKVAVSALARPATVSGYARFSLKNCDYPAVIKHPDSSVDGYLITLATQSQRKKLDNFEGELYKVTPILVTIWGSDGQSEETIEADMYLWNGDIDAVLPDPWEFETFIRERLDDWIDLFDGIELVGDDED